MTDMRACPILPVADLDRALAHYAELGCRVSRHGIREGWHIDPDGNLLRFGSPLPSSG